jgi:hypothetical protein
VNKEEEEEVVVVVVVVVVVFSSSSNSSFFRIEYCALFSLYFPAGVAKLGGVVRSSEKKILEAACRSGVGVQYTFL